MTDVPDPSPASIRPASRIGGQRPYAPPSHEWEIDLRLDANEGSACSRGVLDALSAVDPETLRRYPDAGTLEARIADRWGVDASRVVVTNGADDAIDRVCRALVEPGRSVLLHVPTFEMIARSVELAGGDVRSVAWLDGVFPVESVIGAMDGQTALVALVTPNNPTGGAIALDALRAVADAAGRVGAAVMVDLAYAEFADEDPMRALLDLPNVVVLRTFSKALGLAGLRVGYAIAPAGISTWLRTVGGPYPVSSVSLAAAGACVGGEDERAGFIATVRRERGELADQLSGLGATPLSSQANFVTARFEDAGFVRESLASLGIAVRGFPAHPTLHDCLRVTLPGHDVQFARLTRALCGALRPEAVLFDLDGVIADVSRSYRAAILETAASYNVEVTRADVARAKEAGDANNDWVLTRRLLEERGVNLALDEVIRRFQTFYLGTNGTAGIRERETLIPTPGIVERLTARHRTALVTGRPRNEAEWFLDRVGLSDAFGVLVCMEDAPAKPSPEPVRCALDRLGVATAWMIGDTPDDVRAARGAGVIPIGIVAPNDDPASTTACLRSAGAVRVIDGLEELEEMLP